MRALTVLMLALAACVEGPRAGPRVRLDAGRAEVEAELAVDHRPEATFESVTREIPVESLSDVVVAGTSFEKRADVYLLRLRLKNATARRWELPRLWVRRAEEGEREILFRAGGPPLEPGGSREFTYYWDPGQKLSVIDARLEWRP